MLLAVQDCEQTHSQTIEGRNDTHTTVSFHLKKIKYESNSYCKEQYC